MKRRNFTLSIKQDMKQFIANVEQCSQWAWIKHDKDTNEDGSPVEEHIHAYIEFPNPRSFKSVAELLQTEENMVCKVIDKNGILQYLIHKNQPDKYQYKYDEIHSNFDLEPFFMNKNNFLWQDFCQLKSGKISPNEFYEIHKGDINAQAFYQKLKIFDMISSYESPSQGRSVPPIHTLLKD